MDFFLDLEGLNLSRQYNESNDFVYFMEGYPSGYSLTEVVLVSAIGIIIMAMVIVGNFLVIISIFR